MSSPRGNGARTSFSPFGFLTHSHLSSLVSRSRIMPLGVGLRALLQVHWNVSPLHRAGNPFIALSLYSGKEIVRL